MSDTVVDVLQHLAAGISLVICVLGAGVAVAYAIHAAMLLADGPKFKWIGPPGKATYNSLHAYLDLYLGPEKWLVLKHRWRQEYHVVNLREWAGVYFMPHETTKSAFYKTTEKFDTLEQAMLYFEMVRS